MNSSATPHILGSAGATVILFQGTERFLGVNGALNPPCGVADFGNVILCSINEHQSKQGQGAPGSSCTGVKVIQQAGEHLV